MPKQLKIESIEKETNPNSGLTDILLVDRIIGLRAELDHKRKCLKDSLAELAERIEGRGSTTETIGEYQVTVSDKTKSEHDLTTLLSLKPCVSEEKIASVALQIPSSKQLKELSELGGASAKAVIASSKRKIDTGEKKVRICKPKQRRPRGRGRRI